MHRIGIVSLISLFCAVHPFRIGTQAQAAPPALTQTTVTAAEVYRFEPGDAPRGARDIQIEELSDGRITLSLPHPKRQELR